MKIKFNVTMRSHLIGEQPFAHKIISKSYPKISG